MNNYKSSNWALDHKKSDYKLAAQLCKNIKMFLRPLLSALLVLLPYGEYHELERSNIFKLCV